MKIETPSPEGMSMEKMKMLAVIGGGPTALFILKRWVEAAPADWALSLFEKGKVLGYGMPYGPDGATEEHVTNVSGNEIPDLTASLREWITEAPQELKDRFGIDAGNFNDYKVVPRLLFGEFLKDQFERVLRRAEELGLPVKLYKETTVRDISPASTTEKHIISFNKKDTLEADAVMICTGHSWPSKMEELHENYFESPYPPAKLSNKYNCPIAIRGASLTAIDAIRTLARANGHFEKSAEGLYTYKLDKGSQGFHITLHSIGGMLPSLRFHLEDSHLTQVDPLSPEETRKLMEEHGGFIPLDLLFERLFKEPLREQSPETYASIRDMNLEQFVEAMMKERKEKDPFVLFQEEYDEAERSIRNRESVHWKEMLAVLSYAMNYPAKHFCAEDLLRLNKTLKPLISLVIAFVPQSSARELLALHAAGLLDMQAVDRDSKVEPAEKAGALYRFKDDSGKTVEKYYPVFVDAVGQPALQMEDFPFDGLRDAGLLSQAKIAFRDPEKAKELKKNGLSTIHQGEDADYYLLVPGVAINDYFQILDRYGAASPSLFILAVPFIAGFNPDYSGLDFGEEASRRVVDQLLRQSVAYA